MNKQLDREAKSTDEQLKLENNIQIELIKSIGLIEGMSKDESQIPQLEDLASLDLETSKHEFEKAHKTKELQHKNSIENKKIDLAKEKISSDERIEKLKLKQAKSENDTQKQIAKKDQALQEKEIQIKRKSINKKVSK